MLDMDELRYLDNDAKKKYMILEKGWDTPFWQIMVGWAAQSANEAADRVLTARTWEEHIYHAAARAVFLDIVQRQKINEDECRAISNSIRDKLIEKDKAETEEDNE